MNPSNQHLLAVVVIALVGSFLTSCSKKEAPPSLVSDQPAPVSQPKQPSSSTVVEHAPKSVTPTAVVEPAIVAPSSPMVTPTTGSASLTQGEMSGGLKEALANGIQDAIAKLGRDGGFLNNLDVKIPMPENLQKIEKTLRTVGQGAVADEFVATINRAAEQAVPEAAQVFGDAIRAMTLEDAGGILTGPSDAATQYFRRTSEDQLRQRFLPIVKQATEKTGVTVAYKNLTAKAGPAAAFLGKDASDLDGYVTQKALDGLFKMIAAEEARIRKNPAARTTDLLQKVFGSLRSSTDPK